MKKPLIITLLSLFISVSALAENSTTIKPQQNSNSTACQELRQSGATSEEIAKRGCCSWHQGVCGCSGGRQTCCDGTTSPSCTCHHDDEQKGVEG